jgi:TetR/AcrR family transcriptional repressor of nem operon
MSAKVAVKQDTRTLLIEAGTELMFEKGYTNTGIQEVLNQVGVPKGSFYHYFDSKEAFALAIIQNFDACYTGKVRKTLNDTSRTPLNRLKEYCRSSREGMAAGQCRKGCLIGNLSQEMADQSEVLRQALSQIMANRRALVAACIAEGQKLGEIKKKIEPRKAAELFLSAWEGAVMRSKTTKCTEPLDACLDYLFTEVLAA